MDTTTHPSNRDSNDAHAPHDRFQKPSIRPFGKKFANSKDHRLIRKIFDVSLEGAWPTFKKVPKEALNQMFETFRTTFSWNADFEFASKQAFENVLRDRYSDIMLEMRMESAIYARAAGHFIPKGGYNFNIMSDFPPKLMSQDIWRELCLFWGSEDWGKKSARGRNNRKKGHDSGCHDILVVLLDTMSIVFDWKLNWVEHPLLRNYSFIPTLKEIQRRNFGPEIMMIARKEWNFAHNDQKKHM
ncbi:hypothetical protein R6Q59_019288 [Mikania micrantha]